MEHRADYQGAEQRAYDRGWLDGDDDAKNENMRSGFFHGLIFGAMFVATIATAIHIWWPK